MEPVADIALFVRLISAMILSLAVGKLLTGLAKFIQHPNNYQINILHALWIVFLFGAITTFWWEEAQTFGTVKWTYPLYLYQIVLCSSYLVLTSVLLPDEIKAKDGVENHYQYFMARRHWFFSALMFTYILDWVDLTIKWGLTDLLSVPGFFTVNVFMIVVLAIGIFVPKHWAQVSVAIVFAVLAVIGFVTT